MEDYFIDEKEIETLDIIILEDTDEGFKQLYNEYWEQAKESQELFHEKIRVYRTCEGLICTDGMKTVKKQIALRKERIKVMLFASTPSYAKLTRLRKIEERFKLDNMAKANIYYYLRNKIGIRTTDIAEAIGKTNQYVFQRLDMKEYPENLLLCIKAGVVNFSQGRRYYQELKKYGEDSSVNIMIEGLMGLHEVPSPKPTEANIIVFKTGEVKALQ